jgi:lipopolysaccharide export system protein LptA
MKPPSLLPLAALLLLMASPVSALKSDRQQPLDVKADSTEGTLGDGTATLRGNVEIRQGTLLIQADVARVEKVDGKVRRFEFDGNPVRLQQQIEQEGQVSAEARNVDYEVATGIVTLTGAADVNHPQYHISGDVLRYDLNIQHFEGSGSDEEGRIRIRLDPEVIPGDAAAASRPDAVNEKPPDAVPETQPDAVPQTQPDAGRDGGYGG